MNLTAMNIVMISINPSAYSLAGGMAFCKDFALSVCTTTVPTIRQMMRDVTKPMNIVEFVL